MIHLVNPFRRHYAKFISLPIIFLFCHLIVPTFVNAQTKAQKVHIVILGDSLTEGYGIEKDLAYPKLVEQKINEHLKKLKKTNLDFKVYNAGISGSTSASSLSRLKWFMKNNPTHLFLALGANDGLRGVLPPATKKNLKETIQLAKKNKLIVVLAGMKMPPNYGEKHTKEFEAIFSELAQEEKILFMPFLLNEVAAEEKLNQNDGIHPNEKGHEIIAENVFQFLIKNIPELNK